jgi:hypothetical protein
VEEEERIKKSWGQVHYSTVIWDIDYVAGAQASDLFLIF